MSIYSKSKLTLTILTLIILSSCGGGGGGAPNLPPAPPVNQIPSVDAGEDQVVDEEMDVILSASASDPDGSIASYSWSQLSGESVEISGADSESASFETPTTTEQLALEFQVSVTDNDGAAAVSMLTVTVNPVNLAPTLSVGDDQSVVEGKAVVLVGEASDNDGSIVKFQWSQLAGTSVSLSDDGTTSEVSFSAPLIEQDEILTFELTVIDNEGGEATDSLDIEVINQLQRLTDIFYVIDSETLREVNVVASDGTAHRNSISGSGFLSSRPSPDGRYLGSVYDVGAGGRQLFVDDLTNNDPAYLVSGTLVVNGNVGADWRFSPDSLYLAYQADKDIDTASEIFVVSVTGGESIKMHPNQALGTIAEGIRWSSDSTQVAFRANHNLEEPSAKNLYVANRDGSSFTTLTDLPLGGEVSSFRWVANSNRLLYRNNDVTSTLHIVDSSGDNDIELSDGTEDVDSFDASNSNSVVYRSTLDFVRQIFIKNLDGVADKIRLNGLLVDSGDVGLYIVSPNGQYVAYTADQEIDGAHELYVSEINGSNNTKINPDFAPGTVVSAYGWSRDSTKIAYKANVNSPTDYDLYSAEIDGTGVELLNKGSRGILNFRWSPDSSQIAFREDQDVEGVNELYVATPGSGANPPYKLNDDITEGEVSSTFNWSPDGSRLVYRLNPDSTPDADTSIEAYTVINSVDAVPIKINAPLESGTSVDRAFWLPEYSQ